jgi:hypothetical protein
MKTSDTGVLSLTKEVEAAQVEAAESASKAPSSGPSVTLAGKQDIQEAILFSQGSEIAYARQVELTNGRWAMMGFLAALLVEAGTGEMRI